MSDHDRPPFGFMLSDVTRLLRRNFQRRAQHLGLTQAQLQALARLSRMEGCNQATLADRMELQPITLARLIDKLAEAGLVERHADPTDRRAFLLYLKPAAEPILDEMWRYSMETREQAMNGLSEAERNAFIATVNHMMDQLLDAERREGRGQSTTQATPTVPETAQARRAVGNAR